MGAVLAPVGIVAAAIALALGGGGLHAIGQALRGPQPPAVPPGVRTADGDPGRLLAKLRPGAATRATPRLTATARRTPAAGDRPASTRAVGSPAPRVRPRRPAPAPRPVTPSAAAPAPTPVAAAEAPASTSAPAAGPTPSPSPVSTVVATPAPQATTGPVRALVDGVQQTTDQLPVVGEPVGQVLDALTGARP